MKRRKTAKFSPFFSSLLGDPVLAPGEKPDPKRPRLNNGVTGDPRPSTPDLGKRVFDMKVNYAVEEIRWLMANVR